MGNAKKKVNELSGTLDSSKVKAILGKELQLSKKERRDITEDLATGVLDFFKTSEAVHKYGTLMVGILLAENSEEVKNAIDLAAEKVGGFAVKQGSSFSVTVSSFPGVEYGWEEIDSSDQTADGNFIGATLPIGVELAWGVKGRGIIGAFGIYLQLLDLGAVLNYSLNNDNDDFSNRTDFGFREVLSPGSHLVVHFKDIPIALGGGFSYAPSLRDITVEGSTSETNVLQFGFFVGVDLNVFTLHASDTKFIRN